MIRKILSWFIPAYGLDAIYYIYIAAAVVGAASSIQQARAVEATEALRQRTIKNEVNQAQLDAVQQATNRQIELTFANADVIVNAGNIDPFGSPSLLAIRRFNQQQTEQAIQNIAITLSLSRAQGSNELLSSGITSSTARTIGILDAASSVLGSAAGAQKLSGPKKTKTVASGKSKGGHIGGLGLT